MTTLMVVDGMRGETPSQAVARRLRGELGERRISVSEVARRIEMTQAALSRRMTGDVDKQSKSETVVTYRVTGDGSSAAVTYTDNDVNMGQDTAASLPWEKKVTLKGFVKIASLTATNTIEAGPSTKITCEILVNGEVRFTQSGTGPGASASCSGSID